MRNKQDSYEHAFRGNTGEASHPFSNRYRLESWQQSLQENALSFRKALLVHRDGARLHIGTSPTPPGLERSVRRNYAVYAMQGFQSSEALFILQSHQPFLR
ncbi:TetR/AcrR family transcriptional regulator C-terminal domain-containing protein [Aeromonas hydrophila]|uniref:TetR/AcrR family transcriptional regulator C-terminal domain-containing protein n=1 Tax=Aeromonas hydrophila TaxID=644 RepID=UPI00372CFAFF